MFENKRILFYVPGLDVINDGVFHSQVFGLARYLVKLGAQCLVVQSTIGDNIYGEMVLDDVAILNCPQSSKYVPLPFLSAKLRNSVHPAESRIREFAPTHVYIREAVHGVAAFPLLKDLGAKVVYSCRGAGMAEGYTTIKDYVKEGILRVNMWRLARRSSHVNAVCEKLREYMMSHYFRGSTSVLPCCVMDEKFAIVPEAEKARIRKELNIPQGEKVVVYSGGMGWYQCTDELLMLLRKIHEADPRIVLLILTKRQDILAQKAEEVGLPTECYRTKSCRPDEVAQYLQCADVGVILRKNDRLNQLASPVKIGEYLSSGLGIIASPWIGDVGGLLAHKKFALLYDNSQSAEDLVRFVRSLDKNGKDEAVAFARRYYSYEGNRGSIEEMFA